MQRLTGKLSFNFHSLIAFRQCFPAASTPTLTDSFANYLVDSLGFSHQQALSASTKLSKYRKVNDFNFGANAASVLTFFRHYGFNDTHIAKMASLYPRLLTCNVDITLHPKLLFLKHQGFSGSDIIRVISANPRLLSAGLDSCISPALQVLRHLLLSDTHVIAFLRKLRLRNFCAVVRFLIPNVDLLTSYGIPMESIRKHIIKNPITFLRNPEKFKEIVIRVENKLGIAQDDPLFLYGVYLYSGYSEETVEFKFRMFKSFGWTQSDIDAVMMKHANCFKSSDTTIKKKLDFLMNELRLKPAYLISNSAFLTYSLEKRLMPRHKVFLILREKGLLKKYPSFSYVVCISEPCFLKKFVIPFKETHQVYAEQTSCNMKMLNKESSHDLS